MVGKKLKKLRKNTEANVPSGRTTQNCCATKQNWNDIKNSALKQKRGFPVVSRHAQNPPTEVGQELAGITVHWAIIIIIIIKLEENATEASQSRDQRSICPQQ